MLKRKAEQLEREISREIGNRTYLNVNIVNNKDEPQQCITSQFYNTPIDISRDQTIAVARMVLLGSIIPYFFWEGDEYYQVTIEIDAEGGFSESEYLILPEGGFTYNGKAAIFNYESFQESINKALQSAWDNLITAASLSPTLIQYSPFVQYNRDSKTFDFYLALDLLSALNPRIYLNSKLFRRLQNYHVIVDPNNPIKAAQLLFDPLRTLNIVNLSSKDLVTPDVKYVICKQEVSSLCNLYDVTKIVVKTAMVSTRQEYTSKANPTEQLNPIVNGASGPNSISMLTDFAFSYPEGSASGPRLQQYYTPAFYRCVDLLGDKIYQLDVSLFIVTRDGTEIPLYLAAGECVDMKFVIADKQYST